jgi:hypothetical protein
MSFKCKFECNFTCVELKEVQDHTYLIHHANRASSFQCCHLNCQKNFKKYKDFASHIEKPHLEIENNEKLIKCNVSQCKATIKKIDELYKHYYIHLKEKEEKQDISLKITCFYKDCKYVCSTKNNFIHHLSAEHSNHKCKEKLKQVK